MHPAFVGLVEGRGAGTDACLVHDGPAAIAGVVPTTRAAALARRDASVGLRASRASIDVCIVCLPMCWKVMLGEVVAQARPSLQ
jgi:hypothetical protein